MLGFPGVSLVKNSPAKQKTQVRSLGWEDPLEREISTSILSWRIPWTEEPGGLQSTGSQESDKSERLTHAPEMLAVDAVTREARSALQ